MKKVLPIVAVALLATTFTSCKKDYTCTCNITLGGTAMDPVKLAITKSTKKDAKSACTAAETTYSNGGATAKCSL